MRVFKRGGTYWMDVTFEGRRVRQSTGIASARKAREVATLIHADMVKNGLGVQKRKAAPRLTTAMHDFLGRDDVKASTMRRYKTSSVPLLRHFGDVRVDAIKREDVRAYRSARMEQTGNRTGRGLRPATVNREMTALGAMFRHLQGTYPNVSNPTAGIKPLKENNQETRVLSYAEQRAYLAAATPTLRDVVSTMLETGLRPAEVYEMERCNVHLDRNYLFVPKGKTEAARRKVPLTTVARSVLAARLAAVSGRWLFPCETDSTRPIPKVANAHDRAVKASGVKPFKLYCCRHTWASRMAEAGTDLTTLASLLGHSKLVMVLRYAHPSEAHQAKALSRLEEYNALREIEEFGQATIQ